MVVSGHSQLNQTNHFQIWNLIELNQILQEIELGKYGINSTLFEIVFWNCSIIAHFHFLQNLVEFKWIQKLKVVHLFKLQMTRDKHVWWWYFKNQRNANLLKVRLLHLIKSSNLA